MDPRISSNKIPDVFIEGWIYPETVRDVTSPLEQDEVLRSTLGMKSQFKRSASKFVRVNTALVLY